MSQRRCWKPWEVTVLCTRYANTPTQAIALELNRTTNSVYQRAMLMGLRKSSEYLAGPHACRLRRGDHVGATHRFAPGHVPANKGLRRPGWSAGRMAETQFKPGQKPYAWKPVGSYRMTRDGYLQQKVSDTGYPPRDWKGVHVLNWEKAHGPVPRGYAVCFKDRNKGNPVLDNLELLSRGELMRRNTIHNLPHELTDVIRLNGALKRRIRRLYEEQINRSSQSSV